MMIEESHEATPLKLLWHSNSPSAPSGYGNQTDVFTPRINDDGYDLVLCSFYGHQGSVVTNNHGIIELPIVPNDAHGNSVIGQHMVEYERDAVISLMDPHVLKPQIWGKLDWTAWSPIDCEPINLDNKYALQSATDIWAMSRFGERVLKAAGFENVRYVPHGIDTNIYKPIDRREARKNFHSTHKLEDDQFLVVCVAANKGTPSRKNFSGMLRAFKDFLEVRPNALFYIHTDPHGIYSGDHIPTMVEALGLTEKVLYPSNYHYLCGMYTGALMNNIYNAADVFMLLSLGEGFGIPIMEAQAAGCPVIVTDGSAMSELCLSGWRVESRRIQALNGRFGCDWWLADHDDTVRCLNEAYEVLVDDKARDVIRKSARDGAMAYDADVVYESYMQPAIEAIRDRVAARKSDQAARAEKLETIQADRKLKRAKLRASEETVLEAVAGD